MDRRLVGHSIHDGIYVKENIRRLGPGPQNKAVAANVEMADRPRHAFARCLQGLWRLLYVSLPYGQGPVYVHRRARFGVELKDHIHAGREYRVVGDVAAMERVKGHGAALAF
jgi:hypothetical protein